jgi:GNAT superfamily N-acetyltransferase
MDWPTSAFLGRRIRLPADVRLRQLARADVSTAIAAIGAWCPDLAIGKEQALLTSAFYDEAVALAGEEHTIEERPVYVLLLDSAAGPVGFWAGEYEPDERALLERMALVDSRHRGRGYERALIEAHLVVGQAIGADLVYGFVEMDDRPQCDLFADMGFTLCGILPDSKLKHVASGEARYVPEAFYVRMLGAPENLLWPTPEALLPRTAALMKLLFDDEKLVAPPEPVHAASTPIPELHPSSAALLASRPGGAHTWPDAALLAVGFGLPSGLELRQLARRDIPHVVSVLPAWWPDLVGSAFSYLLTASFYEQSVALAGEDADLAHRPGYVALLCADGSPVAFGYVKYVASQSQLRAEAGTVDPRYRGRGLSSVCKLMVLLGRALGVNTIVAPVTLRHPFAQTLVEHSGFRLVGIFPGSDRVQVSPGVMKPTLEAMYAISLLPEERTHRPAFASLSPRMAAVARFVLGEPSRIAGSDA